MKLMLDTTFVVDFLRRNPAAVTRLQAIHEAGDDPIVTSVVVTEAWTGARRPDDADLDALLRYIEYVHPGPATARLAGTWRAEARLKGRTIGMEDALIGATAFHQDAVVLTRNIRDFIQMPVRVETY
jgi:predicted nucleic acid-binding protein